MKVLIVMNKTQKGHKSVILFDENAQRTPRAPKGYRKSKGDHGFIVTDSTPEQVKHIRQFYDQVIDLRGRART